MDRQRVAAGTHWEPIVGYSRAVRVGNTIYVSGTAATDDAGQVVGLNDPHAQTKQALRKIEAALQQLGGAMTDVVRTRMYVTNIDYWEDYGRAHGEFFGDVRPATAMVEVSRLIDARMLVEIEAEAVV